jgi:hypothetical protein
MGRKPWVGRAPCILPGTGKWRSPRVEAIHLREADLKNTRPMITPRASKADWGMLEQVYGAVDQIHGMILAVIRAEMMGPQGSVRLNPVAAINACPRLRPTVFHRAAGRKTAAPAGSVLTSTAISGRATSALSAIAINGLHRCVFRVGAPNGHDRMGR